MAKKYVPYKKLNEIVFAGCGPSQRTLQRWAKNDGLPVFRKGMVTLYSIRDVQKFLERHKRGERFEDRIVEEPKKYNPGCSYSEFVKRLREKSKKELK